MKNINGKSTLTGKTALVTGGASKIGREICFSLAQQGVNVVIHYQKSAIEAKILCKALQNNCVKAWAIQADFKKAKAVKTLVEKALRVAGKLDMVINNASVFSESTLTSMEWPDLLLNMQVNALAPLVIGREFNKSCSGSGSIINMLDSRICGQDQAHAGYIVSKHALAALTSMMALEFAPEITVNAVAPGLIAPSVNMSTLTFKALSKKLPLKRHGEPQDVAQAVLFLLQSAFITGQVIYVDGGRNIRELNK